MDIQMKGSSKPLLYVDITIKNAMSRSNFDSQGLPGSCFMLWPQHHCTGSPGLSVAMLSTKVLILTWQACHLTVDEASLGEADNCISSVLTTVHLYFSNYIKSSPDPYLASMPSCWITLQVLPSPGEKDNCISVLLLNWQLYICTSTALTICKSSNDHAAMPLGMRMPGSLKEMVNCISL